MRKLFSILIVLTIGLLPCHLFAASDSVFSLRTPVYTAYGFTGVGAQLGAESVYVNPSVLNAVSHNIFEACYGRYYSAMSTTTLMLTRSGTLFGGSFAGFYTNNMINGLLQTDDNNGDHKPEVIGNMEYFGQSLLISYYNSFSSIFNYSFGVRYIDQGISGIKAADHPWYSSKEKGTGYGYNAGFSSSPLDIFGGLLQLGVGFYDLGGTQIKWSSSIETISQSYKVGLSWQQNISAFLYNILVDSGTNGLSYGAGLNLLGTGLSFAAGTRDGTSTVGMSYDAQSLIVSLAYLNHADLGGSYTLAVAFPIIPDALKTNVGRIESEFSTLKGGADKGLSGTALVTTVNIEDELENLKNQNRDLFNDHINEFYNLYFSPDKLVRGQTVHIVLQPKSSLVERATIKLESAKVVLKEEVNIDDNIPEKFREAFSNSLVKSFTGNIVMPDKPGEYWLYFIFSGSEGTSGYKELIQVN